MDLHIIEPEDLVQPGKRAPYSEGEKTGIVRYLSGGSVLLPIPRQQVCREEDCGLPAGKESVRTDGQFLWGEFYAHYILSHGYSLPEEFFLHMHERRFDNPEVPADQLWLLKKKAFGGE